MKTSRYIWFNGKLVPWADANVHVMTHALHYGSSVFEGVRCYKTNTGPAMFRLGDHLDRLFESAKIYRMQLPYTREELSAACHAAVHENGLESAYLRPIALRGNTGFGVAPPPDGPIDVIVIAAEFGAYLGEEGLKHGIDACVTSWNRAAPNTFPTGAKAGGNYLSSQLIAMEARRLGFGEGLALSVDGQLSEGAGENLFVIRNGKIYTPPAAASILLGITRDTIVKLAEQLGIAVVEQVLPREMLYVADEVFLTGTAAEITPVRSVDGITVGSGSRGPITHALQDAFFGLFDGRTADAWGWLEHVAVERTAVAAVA